MKGSVLDMSEVHAPEHFSEWNEQMVRRYDPEVFHHHPRGVVRWVEHRRASAVINSVNANPEDRILDVGCGAANILAQLPRGKRLGVDLSRFMVERARERLKSDAEVMLGDAEQLPFPSQSFDRVIASSLFSHVLHPDKVAAEIKRVVKPGGRIIVSVSDEAQIEKGLRWAKALLLERFFVGAAAPGQVRVYNTEYHLHHFSLKRMREVMGTNVREISLRRVPVYIFPVHWVAVYEMS